MTDTNKLTEIAKVCGAVFTTKGEKTMLQVASWDERMIFTKAQLQATIDAVNAINTGAIAETMREASARAISDHNEITKLKAALEKINTLRSSTMNYGVARAIACEALGIPHTDSKQPNNADAIESTNSAIDAEHLQSQIALLSESNENWMEGFKSKEQDLQLADAKLKVILELVYEEKYQPRDRLQRIASLIKSNLTPAPSNLAPPQVNATIKCNCDLRTRLVGDGCEKCNPEYAIEQYKMTIDDLREEIEELEAKQPQAVAQDAERYRRLRENWLDCDELDLHGRTVVIDMIVDEALASKPKDKL